MPRLLNQEQLIHAIENETFIINGRVANVEGSKYDFRLGTKILKADFQAGLDTLNLTEQQKAQLYVEPGEVVFVLTEESLKLPKNIKANLIQKRKLSHGGILILGGLSIDPLYEGRLLIGLYNFSSTNFPIIPGRKIIAAQFYELIDEELGTIPEPLNPIIDFPDDLIMMMSKYKPISTNNLYNELHKIEADIKKINADLLSRNDYFIKFEKNLEDQQSKIGEILRLIEKETTYREKGDDKLDLALQETNKIVQSVLQKLAPLNIILTIVLLGIIMAVANYALDNLFGK